MRGEAPSEGAAGGAGNMNAAPELALAIVGSPTTAIAAELVAARGDYREVRAIIRRGAETSLPIAMDGEAWAARLRDPGWFNARREFRGFADHISEMTGGRRFDCLIHHSKDPFSQLLSSHPLCRSYFFIEEGFTALVGGTFGRPKKRPFRKLAWALRSRLFYGGKINRYREFFDISSPKFGGVFALSAGAFRGFPKRVQLQSQDLALATPLPAPLVVFLDSQYLVGNCGEPEYAAALADCLRGLVRGETRAAVKFHPRENDPERKRRFMEVIRSVPGITSLTELPPSFVGERMEFDPAATVVVGTSAIGLYLGERGFRTYSFAQRLAPTSERFAKVVAQIPKEFLEVCASA